jgi:hypothetical protein
LVWLSTSDFSSFVVIDTNVPISPAGIFGLPALPSIIQLPANQTVLNGQNAILTVTVAGSSLVYEWFRNNNSIPGASGPVLSLTNVSFESAGNYIVTVTNSSGASISSMATLTVVAPPCLSLGPSKPGTVQWNANSIAGLTYIVQTASNLINPNWVSLATNIIGNDGSITFQTNAVGLQSQFYRVVFP